MTVDPYSMTMELDDAEAKLSITGHQTVRHLDGGPTESCTSTLTATATRS